MFLVSGPEMVIGASRAGVAGSFPAANCRTSDELDAWLAAITAAIGNSDGAVDGAAPWGINLVAHRLNKRLAADLELAVRYKAPLVITSLGGPRSEEHTSEPVTNAHLVCRLLLEKKTKK